jgi:hypothetical protein
MCQHRHRKKDMPVRPLEGFRVFGKIDKDINFRGEKRDNFRLIR